MNSKAKFNTVYFFKTLYFKLYILGLFSFDIQALKLQIYFFLRSNPLIPHKLVGNCESNPGAIP